MMLTDALWVGNSGNYVFDITSPMFGSCQHSAVTGQPVTATLLLTLAFGWAASATVSL